MSFVPHTDQDIQKMLSALSIDTVDALFDEIPSALKATTFGPIFSANDEMSVAALMQKRASENRLLSSFIGAGAYEHYIPAPVWQIASRAEFMTNYTPYQAEASQGILQLLYEYQTMMASLTGLDCSNVSLYDGATALAEAILMAVRIKKSKNPKILLPFGIPLNYFKVLITILSPQGVELLPLNMDPKTGRIDREALADFEDDNITAMVILEQNLYGVLETPDDLVDWAKDHDCLTIGVVNPTALALFKEPGAWGKEGVDIACGEGQPLGCPLSFGGPYFGFLTCREKWVRQMPGRIVGKTIDLDGKEAFTLTLQAREQHIRRDKATSNICTNQGLMVVAATVYLSLLGFEGLKNVAQKCYQNAHQLAESLIKLPDVALKFEGEFFHEFTVTLPMEAGLFLKAMRMLGIDAGFDLFAWRKNAKNQLLICCTETKTKEAIDDYVKAFSKVLEQAK